MQATTVAARGLAETAYTVAGFNIVLSDKDLTVPAAKAKLKAKVEELHTVLDALRQKLSFDYVKNSVRVSSNVQEDYEYHDHKNRLVGYNVSYNLFFQVDDLNKVNEIYDALTSLAQVKVSSPTFGLKPAQREKLNKKALKDAFAKVTERFKSECKVLNLNPDDFEISNWEVTYWDSQRGDNVAHAMVARFAANSSFSEEIGASADMPVKSAESLLVAGLAEVVVNLEVGYILKNTK